VLEQARILGYRANPNARRLRTASTGMIAVITRVDAGAPWVANDLEFISRITQQICAQAWERGYFPTLLPSSAAPETVVGLPLDGVIMIDPFREDVLLAALVATGIPTLSVSPNVDEGSTVVVPSVDTNTAEATMDLLQRLGDTGVRRAILVSSEAEQSYLLEPARTFQTWAAESGVRADVMIFPPASDLADCYRMVFEAVQDDAVDLVHIVTEAFIPAVLAALRDAGRRIPEDVQVVTASDSLQGRTAVPPLTSLDLVPEALGTAAMDLLHTMLTVPGAEPLSRVLEASIQLRGSTRIPADDLRSRRPVQTPGSR
jgi:DNA-binding LacI/PurR family transcriptional regulator